jgi:hypothetical protein
LNINFCGDEKKNPSLLNSNILSYRLYIYVHYFHIKDISPFSLNRFWSSALSLINGISIWCFFSKNHIFHPTSRATYSRFIMKLKNFNFTMAKSTIDRVYIRYLYLSIPMFVLGVIRIFCNDLVVSGSMIRLQFI